MRKHPQGRATSPIPPSPPESAPRDWTAPNRAIDRALLIPIHHENVKAKSFYLARSDFYSHYEKSEENEIGCVFDTKTGQPICRVVCDITTPRADLA